MRLSELTENENSSHLAKHYTEVLNTRFAPHDIPLRITTHFVDQIKNPRNIEPISLSEVADFFSKLLLKKTEFLQKLPEGSSVLVNDYESGISVPVAKINNVLVMKTIMRGEMRRGSQQKIAI